MMISKLNASLGALVALGIGLTPVTGSSQEREETSVMELDPLTVTTATRTVKLAAALPQTISVILPEALDEQLAVSGDLIGAIAQLTPSYSPPRQKMTGFGETFRGRSPLFLLDGVPQSNPLRDGSRDGYTIDPAMIERIELVHGASAAQGMGATGGIINFVTIKAPEEPGVEQWLQAGLTSSDEFEGEGIGYRAAYRVRAREGRWGGVFAAVSEWRPMAYDGEGRFVGIDNTQGDTMNARTWDVYGKGTYTITPEQSLTVSFNRFLMEQELEYVSVPGDPQAGLPTTSVKGETPGKPATNDVWTLTAHYRHAAFLEGELAVELFANDFAATYGGGTFGVFINNGERIFDQSENQSRKHGGKLTFVRDFGDLGLVTGVDYLSDETQQVLVQTGRKWVPETTFESWAPYLQLDRPWGPLSLTGGVRLEQAELVVDDFRTLEAYGAPLVAGGNPSFDEWLLNLGATWMLDDSWTLYSSFAQGFGMADVGRVLRGISEPGLDVDDFLDLEPVVTDNYELGVRYGAGTVRGSASAFWSTSDLGSRLQADADGIFSVMREKTEIWGFEADLEMTLGSADRIGLAFAHTRGDSDTDGDGEVDTPLNGTIIPPTRLNLHWTRVWAEGLRTRLQSSTFFDRGTLGFDGYSLLDLLVVASVGPGEVSFAIENLLDESYITYYSQTAGNASRYFAGRGRTFRAQYTLRF